MRPEEPSFPARRALAALAAAVLAASSLLAAACSGPGPARRPADHDHGTVVASLPIPFQAPAAASTPDVIAVTVTEGQRFSVKVTTSDGPYYWEPAGQPPDPALVRHIGDFNDGHCARRLVGCRVPYFATYAARHPGTTSMTWAFHALPCPAATAPASPAPAGTACPRITLVTFRITIARQL